jgi:hypothetical protein
VQEGQYNCWNRPVKAGVWCGGNARRIVVRVFFNETINCERYLHVEGQRFQHLLWSVNRGKTSLHSKCFRHAESQRDFNFVFYVKNCLQAREGPCDISGAWGYAPSAVHTWTLSCMQLSRASAPSRWKSQGTHELWVVCNNHMFKLRRLREQCTNMYWTLIRLILQCITGTNQSVHLISLYWTWSRDELSVLKGDSLPTAPASSSSQLTKERKSLYNERTEWQPLVFSTYGCVWYSLYSSQKRIPDRYSVLNPSTQLAGSHVPLLL